MKKIAVVSALALSTFLMVQCTPKKVATTTEKTPAATVADLKKTFSAEQLAEGKNLSETACKKCHRVYIPEELTVDKWERVLPRMINRAKLDEAEGAKVRAYCLINAKQGE